MKPVSVIEHFQSEVPHDIADQCLHQDGTSRECVEGMDRRREQLHYFAVIPSEFTESACLLLKHGGDGLDGIAIFGLPSERMAYCDSGHGFNPIRKEQGTITGIESRL